MVLHESAAGNLSSRNSITKTLFVGLAPEESFNIAQADMLGDVIADLEDNLTAGFMETDPDKKVSQWWKSLLFFS